MVLSLAPEMLRYRRVEGQEQVRGMELYAFLLMSRWVSLESFATSLVIVEKDWTAEGQRYTSLQASGNFSFKLYSLISNSENYGKYRLKLKQEAALQKSNGRNE